MTPEQLRRIYEENVRRRSRLVARSIMATAASSGSEANPTPVVAPLVTNGDGSSGTAGWTLTGGNGTLTNVGGKLRVTVDPAAAYVQFSQPVTTVVAANYNTLADVTSINAGAFWGVRKADDAALTTNLVELSTGDGLAQARTFTATATTSYIVLQVNTNNAIVDFDNIVWTKV